MTTHDVEMITTVSGTAPGQRRLNGVQRPGRSLRNLGAPTYATLRTRDVPIAVRDGTTLLADTYRPDAPGRFPALIAFSCYPRQIQDLGAPLGRGRRRRLLRAARLRPHRRQCPRHGRLGRRVTADASVNTIHASSRLALPVLATTM